GHSAVIHSRDARTILAYGAAVNVLRVTVNAPGSTGTAGLDTHLPPSMTIGTGFFGRSALTENLQPHHLVQWTRLAYGVDEPLGDVALKSTELQAGILVVERQFGYLEFHSRSTASVRSASEAVLDELGATPADATPPQVLAAKLVSRLDHQHAFLINRNKLG